VPVSHPPLLRPMSHIRVVSPSWPAIFYAPQRAERAEQALRALGFRVTYGEFAAEVTDDGIAAGTPQQRAADFMNAVNDPGVDAILSAGGGDRTWELLPLLDADAIRRSPKPFVGHCENTWLNHYLLEEAGLTSFYGTTYMAHLGEAGGIFPETGQYFLGALVEGGAQSFRPVPRRTNQFFNWQDPAIEGTRRELNVAGGWHWVRPGRGSGRLLGSEISIFTRMIGHFDLDLAGTVLFWDVAPTNADSVADLLRDAAKVADLGALAGMIVGGDVRYEPEDWADRVSSALSEVVGVVDYPVVVNADIGHVDPLWLLPYGREAVLDSRDGIHVPAAGSGADR
jgi:muramoyltetrapeptide carboxypeptidase